MRRPIPRTLSTNVEGGDGDGRRHVPVNAAEVQRVRRAGTSTLRALAVVALAACSDGGTGNSPPLRVVSLVLASGDWQAGEVGSALPGNSDGFTLGSEVSQRCPFVWIDEYTSELGEEYDVPCSTRPVLVRTRATVSSIAVAQNGACAVLATAELECWGSGAPPRTIPGARATKAWIVEATVCAADGTGSVPCWIWSSYNLGLAQRPFGDGPTLVNIHSSGRHHCGLSSAPSGIVYCWGTNYDGALGDGTTQHRSFPVPVVGIPVSYRRP